MKLTEMVKGTATFTHMKCSNMYYDVTLDGHEHASYSFHIPISLDELGTSTLEANHKAITLMRYIRKAIKNNTLVYYKQQETSNV
jgi:hypothetical protein